jgi:hypothetical protein
MNWQISAKPGKHWQAYIFHLFESFRFEEGVFVG